MKKSLYIIILLSLPCIASGQSLNDGMYSEEWIKERDAIANGNQERQRWQEDYYYNQIMSQIKHQDNEIEKKVREATIQAQQQSYNQTTVNSSTSASIQFSNDNYDKVLQERRQAAARQKAKEQAKKAQREAEHQQWLAQKRAAQAAAAERERQRRERERIEQERRYKKALTEEYQRSAAHYSNMHAGVDYKATEGYERMYYTQPEGTERMQSSYVPSSINVGKADIAYIVSKHSSGHTVSLTMSGNEHSSLNSSDYEKALDDYFFSHQVKELPAQKPFDKTWSELLSKWDGGQKAYMEYLLESGNGGKMPYLMGKNKYGNYVFEANDKNKLFVVSEDGAVLKIVEYENHSISDENLIKKIKEEGWSMDLVKSKDIEVKGGYIDLYKESLDWKDGSKVTYSEKEKDNGELETKTEIKKEEKSDVKSLKDLEDEDLYKMLPEIRKKYELSLFDNSSKMEGQIYTVSKQNDIAYGVTTSAVLGGKGSVTGGQKSEITAQGTASVSKGLEGKLGGSVTVLEGGAEGTTGMVVGVGDRYYLASATAGADVSFGVGAEVKGGIKYGNKNFKAEGKVSFPGASVKIKVGGTVFKCLNCEK